MIRKITDSAPVLEPQEYKKRNVECIPLCVAVRNIEYQENASITKDMLQNKLGGE